MERNRRIRVLLVLESQGGSRRHVVDLIHGLDQSRFELALIYGTSRMDAQFVEGLDDLRRYAKLIPCDDVVRPISPKHELAALRQVRRVIRAFRPDVVHCHSSKAGIIGRLAAKREHVPLVFYTPHAYSFQAPEFGGRKRVVFVGLERWFSRHATTCTFNVSAGERDAALAERLDKPGKFRVIVNGIPDSPVPSRAEAREMLGLESLGVPAGAPVVGVTARMVEQKDPMTFARIAARVVAQRPDVHFCYVGDGPLEPQVAAWLAERGVADHVHLLGYRQDADDVVAAFNVYLLTSLYEGMPYSLIEALRAGVPIAATRVTGNDEVVCESASGVSASGKPASGAAANEKLANGALFPVGDDEAGAQAVLRLLGNPPSREQVRATYLERFTLDRMVAAIAGEYEGNGSVGGTNDANAANKADQAGKTRSAA